MLGLDCLPGEYCASPLEDHETRMIRVAAATKRPCIGITLASGRSVKPRRNPRSTWPLARQVERSSFSFPLTLPIRSSADVRNRKKTQRLLVDVSRFGGDRLVLVVDDHRDFCIAMEHLVGSLGFRVMFAHDGVEALKKVKAQPVSVVITDLFMPEMDGLELLRRLDHLRIDKPIPPVIAVTGNDHVAADSVGNTAA